MDARLEVAVAREHRRADEVICDDGLFDCSASGPALPMQVVQP